MFSTGIRKTLSFTVAAACLAAWAEPSMALRPKTAAERDQAGVEELRVALATPDSGGNRGIFPGGIQASPRTPVRAAVSAPAAKAGAEEPARLLDEAGKRDRLLAQSATSEWKDFAAQSLAMGTAPKNFADRYEAFLKGIDARLQAIDPSRMSADDQNLVRNTLSSAFYTYLFLTSPNKQAVTLSNRKKYGADAMDADEIKRHAERLLDLLAWAEGRFPAAAQDIIEKEWQANLITLGLANFEQPYGVMLPNNQPNIGTTIFSQWAEEAKKNGHTFNFRRYITFLEDKIKGSNASEAALDTREIWGHDYGGITTRIAALVGNFDMMNPTLVRRGVLESAEAQARVRTQVQAAAQANPSITPAQLWAEGTFAAGWFSRMARYPTFMISLGQEGQVSLQLNPQENDRDRIRQDVMNFVAKLAEEGALFFDNFVVDAEVVSEQELASAFTRPDGSNVSKVNAVFKVDGSNPVNYGDIVERAIQIVQQRGSLDLVELGRTTDSLVAELHRQGIFTNYTAHGRVGFAASLTQWAGNAAARADGIPVHGGYVTQMAGRLDESAVDLVVHFLTNEDKALGPIGAIPSVIAHLSAQPDPAGENAQIVQQLQAHQAEIKKISPASAQGTVDKMINDRKVKLGGADVPLEQALNQLAPAGSPRVALPNDSDIRLYGATIMQRTEKLLTPLREKLAPQGVTVNESAQLLASTRPWVVNGNLVHFAHTTGTSGNIKRGWFPSTGLVPLEKVTKQELRALLSASRAAQPGTVVEEIPQEALDRLVDSSIGAMVKLFTQPNAAEAQLFELVTGAPSPVGREGLLLTELDKTRFINNTFTGNYNTSKYAKLTNPGQFIGDAVKFEKEMVDFAKPAGAEEAAAALQRQAQAVPAAFPVLRELRATLPAAPAILSGKGFVAGPHATGLAYGVLILGRITHAGAFVVENERQVQALTDMGVSRQTIFLIGAPEMPTKDAAVAAALQYVSTGLGITTENVVQLGTQGPVNRNLQLILQNLFGLNPGPADILKWEEFVEQVFISLMA